MSLRILSLIFPLNNVLLSLMKHSRSCMLILYCKTLHPFLALHEYYSVAGLSLYSWEKYLTVRHYSEFAFELKAKVKVSLDHFTF